METETQDSVLLVTDLTMTEQFMRILQQLMCDDAPGGQPDHNIAYFV